MAKHVLSVVVGVLLGIWLISLIAEGAELEAQKAALEGYVPQDRAICVMPSIETTLPCIEMTRTNDKHHVFYAVLNEEITELLLIASKDERTNAWEIVWP